MKKAAVVVVTPKKMDAAASLREEIVCCGCCFAAGGMFSAEANSVQSNAVVIRKVVRDLIVDIYSLVDSTSMKL